MMRATTPGLTPSRKAFTPLRFINVFMTEAMSSMIRNAGMMTPSVARIAPSTPPCENPTNVAIFTAIGPGVDSDTAIKSIIWVSVSQPFETTVSRTSEIIP